MMKKIPVRNQIIIGLISKNLHLLRISHKTDANLKFTSIDSDVRKWHKVEATTASERGRSSRRDWHAKRAGASPSFCFLSKICIPSRTKFQLKIKLEPDTAHIPRDILIFSGYILLEFQNSSTHTTEELRSAVF